MATKKNLSIKLIKSKYGCKPKQRATLTGLGLTKREQVVVVKNIPVMRGMIKKVLHLLEVREV